MRWLEMIYMRPVHHLFLAIFIMSLGFGVMTPAVSLYSILSFGVNEWELGILGALVSLPYLVGPAIFGGYSDKVGRRPFILVGLSLYGIVALAYIFAPNFLFLALLRVLEGLCFSMIWPASEAWVGDLSSALERSRLIGQYSVAWSAGYMFGPFILGIMVSQASINYAFMLASGVVFASAPMILSVRRTMQKRDQEDGVVREGRGAPIGVVLFAMVIWGVAQLAYFFLLPAYTLEVGLPAAYAGYLIGTVAFFRTLVFVVYPRLFRRMGNSILPTGMLLIAVSMLATWLAQDIPAFALASSVLGIALGMVYASSLTMALDRPAKGLYAGLFESGIGIGQMAGPLSMGYIGFIISPSAPYFAMAMLGGASAVAVWLVLLREGGRVAVSP